MAILEERRRAPLPWLLSPARLWQGLRSMTFAIIMLTVILLVIVAGSLLPQDSGIRLVYQSWWFYGLNFVLMASVLSCISRRARGVIRYAFRVPVVHRAEFYLAGDTARELETHLEPERAVGAAARALRRRGYRVVLEERDGHFYLLADRFRVMRLGTLVSHVSIVLLVGSIVWGALAGWLDKTILIEAGGAPVPVGHGTGLTLRSDSFDFGFYPNGTPSNFHDHLALTDSSGHEYHQLIDVNTPWYYGGVFGLDIHQASYAVTARLIAIDPSRKDPRTGAPTFLPYCVIEDGSNDCATPEAAQPCPFGSCMIMAPLPDGTYTPIGNGLSAFYLPSRNLAISVTFHDPVPMARLQATAVVDVLQPPQNGQPMQMLRQQADLVVAPHMLPPQPGAAGKVEYFSQPITVKGVRLALWIRRVTGLNIGHNPAVPFIFTAFTLIILGMTCVLYFPFSRFWLYVAPSRARGAAGRQLQGFLAPGTPGRGTGGSTILLRGAAEKSKQGFKRRFDELARAVQRELQVAGTDARTERSI